MGPRASYFSLNKVFLQQEVGRVVNIQDTQLNLNFSK